MVNVGAGAGNYEPRDRHVIAIEPSDVMAAQRPPDRVPAINASAGRLPLRDQSVDAAMAILSVHHWDRDQRPGVRELRRVARGPVVILTYDERVSSRMWLIEEYLPEVAALDRRIFPDPALLAEWLGGQARVETVPSPRDTPDWNLGSFWAHPERVLDAQARNATSGSPGCRRPPWPAPCQPSSAICAAGRGISATDTCANSTRSTSDSASSSARSFRPRPPIGPL